MDPRKVALLAVAVALAPAAARAQYEQLENPGHVSAVQERLYRMNHELTLGIGILPWDAFYKGAAAQVSYTYHFNDYFAWQVGRGLYSYTLNTGLREQLERDFGVQPTAFDVVDWAVGSDLMFSPIYGKFALMNAKVVHFDVHFTGGATVFKMNDGSGGLRFKPAVALGVGARVYQNRWVSFRLDVTDNIVVSKALTQIPTVFLTTALNFGATE